MSSTRACLLLLSFAALGGCAAPEGSDLQLDDLEPTTQGLGLSSLAPSTIPTSPIPLPPDPCLLKSADVTGVFGPDQAIAYYGTTNTTYASTPCGRFVMDLHVASTHTPPLGYFSEFAFASYSLTGGVKDYVVGATAANCDESWVRVTYYKKVAGTTTWHKIGGGLRRGTLDAYGDCRISPIASYVNPGLQVAPATGTDLYRIAVAVKYKGVMSGVAIRAEHQEDAPQ